MKKTAQGNKETEGTGLDAVLQPIWDQLDQLKEKPLSLEELQRPERCRLARLEGTTGISGATRSLISWHGQPRWTGRGRLQVRRLRLMS